MQKLNYVAKSMNVLNGLLILAVAAAAYYVVAPFLNPESRSALPMVRTTAPEKFEQPASPPNLAFADYAMVGEQNLFHPERKIPQEKKAETEKPVVVVIPKPDLVLYGTLISDDLSIAYIEDRKAPFSSPGRGTRPRPMKKGDNINGYVLRDITANRIVLVLGQNELVVLLDQKDKKRGGETAPAIAASPAAALPPRSPLPNFSPAAASSPGTKPPSPAPAPAPTPAASSATAPGSASSGNTPVNMWPPRVRRPPYSN